MKRFVLILILLFMAAGISFGEEGKKITINGQGKIETAPDMAVVSFAVESTGKELPPIKKENDAIMRRAVEALKRSGISREDMFTASYNISRHYDYPVRDKRREMVYTVRNQMRVTVRDIEKVGEVISALEESGVNTIQGINYTTSKGEDLILEALGEAYKDARRKAQYLAELEGYRAEVVSISHTGYPPRPEVYMAADAAAARNGTPVYNPTEVSVNATVTAVFNMVK